MSLRDVGPTRDTFAFTPQHSATGRVTALAAAPDGSRLYAGSFAGVWRSDDGGQNWLQMTWAEPGIVSAQIPGALFAPNIYDVAISPADADIVLVSALNSQFTDVRDGIYRSTDAGATWTLVLEASLPYPQPPNIVFAPDDASLVFAAVGSGVSQSTDGGVTWTTVSAIQAWHVAVGPVEPGGARRVYAVGDSVVSYSADGGATWNVDAGVATINASRSAIDTLRTNCNKNNQGIGGFGGSTDIEFAGGAGARVLAIEPGNPARVYMATEGAANGPTYYDPAVSDGTLCNTVCARLAGEAGLWLGDFSQFSTANPSAQWTSLPGPPVYYGVSSPSGVTFAVTKPTSTGFLLFFADCSHVHVSAGTPTATTSWHRLDGEDVSAAKLAQHDSNVLWVHVDPHGLAFTSDFEITLAPATGVTPPYNQNSVLSQYIGGKLWMANDGGVVWCADGGRGPTSWNWPLGLNTLDPVNIAGLFGIGRAPALYFGCGDNDDFFSRDGGASWGDPGDNCGDCDAWFTDTVTTDRVIQFLPRQKPNAQSGPGSIGIIVSSDSSQYPDASNAASKTLVPSTQIVSTDPTPHLVPYASSGSVLKGFRPIVQTLVTESPLPDGDYVFINQDLNTMVASLVRTRSIRSITLVSDWLDPAKATVVGPPLPANAFIVQVSGGHQSPVFYVGDGNYVWKLNPAANAWTQIVPNPGQVSYALMWFVNPYDPEIYVLDYAGVKVSADGGQNWLAHAPMTNALTAGGSLGISASLLQDMQFSRVEPETRFAVGRAGVVCSMDFGFSWFPVLNSIAVPGIPESGFFDPVSNPYDRAFYVECQGRSVLRIGNLPNPPSIQPAPVFDLMEFAALDY